MRFRSTQPPQNSSPKDLTKVHEIATFILDTLYSTVLCPKVVSQTDNSLVHSASAGAGFDVAASAKELCTTTPAASISSKQHRRPRLRIWPLTQALHSNCRHTPRHSPTTRRAETDSYAARYECPWGLDLVFSKDVVDSPEVDGSMSTERSCTVQSSSLHHWSPGSLPPLTSAPNTARPVSRRLTLRLALSLPLPRRTDSAVQISSSCASRLCHPARHQRQQFFQLPPQ